MIDANELRKGVIFEQDGELYKVKDYHHNKTARGGATTASFFRSLPALGDPPGADLRAPIHQDLPGAADRIQRPIPGRQEKPCGRGRGRRPRRRRTADRPVNQSRSVLRPHVRRQGLRAEDGRGGDRCNTRGLAIGGGHGLERGFLAKDGAGAPAARSVLILIVTALNGIWRKPVIGCSARVPSAPCW